MALLGLFKNEAEQRAAFAREVIRTATESGQAGPWSYDPALFRVTSPTRVFDLALTWQQHEKAGRAERAAILSRFAQGDQAIPDSREALLACLRPMLRDRRWLELYAIEVRRTFGEPFEGTLPHLPLAHHHVVTLVAYHGKSMSTVTADALAKAGVSFDEAFAAAGANLRKLPPGFRELKRGLWVSVEEDDFDASRLLLRSLHQLDVKGDPVALAANRNALFVTGDGDENGLALLAQLAAKELSEPRSLAPLLLRSHDGDWVEWLPNPDSPNWATFHRWQLKAELERYNHQKAALEELEQQLGEGAIAHPLQDYFYGSLMARGDGADVRTFSFWFPTPTLLPKCDLVSIRAEENGPILEVPWSSVVEVMGPDLEQLHGYPERWRAETFPNADQLNALRRAGNTID